MVRVKRIPKSLMVRRMAKHIPNWLVGWPRHGIASSINLNGYDVFGIATRMPKYLTFRGMAKRISDYTHGARDGYAYS